MPKVKPKPTDGASLKPRVKVSKRTVKKMSAEGPKRRMRRTGEPPNRSMTAAARARRRARADEIRKGNPGAAKFQQPKGRRGNG
jgi:hypothetical protein